jgi:hypothetical protein
LLPDLVADPAEQPRFEVEGRRTNRRLLVRFNGYVHNTGPGIVEVRGSNRQGLRMDGFQRLFRADGTFVDHVQPGNRPNLDYETDDGHDHWHVQAVARYALVTEDRSSAVTAAPKAGFCLLDTERIEQTGPTAEVYQQFCERRQPEATEVSQGVSPGWRDLYDGDLQFQWLNASWVPPGPYRIRTEIDPDNQILEADENNAPGFTEQIIPIPGHRARPLAIRTDQGRPARIRLRADSFGSPGPRRYRVVSKPRFGSVNRRVGKQFTIPRVIYRPKSGFTGFDSFSYAVTDANSPFPKVPVIATATIWVGPSPAPRVAIGGLATRVRVGAGMQLTSTVGELPGPEVTWSVSGIPGGDAAVGTISPAGVYTPPAAVPDPRVVTIRATSIHNSAAYSERPVKIADAEGLLNALLVISRPRVSLRGRTLVTSAISGAYNGKIRFGARVGARKLRGCVRPVRQFRTQGCRIKVPRGVDPNAVRMVVTVTDGKLVLARRGYGLPR